MLNYPQDNKLLRAALTGHLEMDEEEHTRFTPWIELLMGDLSTLSEKLNVENLVEKGIREEIRKEDKHPNGDFIWKLFDILEWDEDKLKMFEHKPEKQKQRRSNR